MNFGKCMHSVITIPIKIEAISVTPESSLVPTSLVISFPITLHPKQPLVWFLSLWIIFVSSRTSYKWNPAVCTLLCLFFFAQFNVFEVHACISFSFLLMCAIVWIYHSLFIHAPVDKHIGHFLFLAYYE